MKKHKCIKKLIQTTAEIFIIIMILASILLQNTNIVGWIVEPGYEYSIENEIYRVNAPMNFSRVIDTDTFIIFNNTGWNITAPSNILITLRHINESTSNSVENDELLEFEVYMVSGSTTIRISGFRGNTIHTIYKDSISDTIFLSNITGVINITIDSGVSYIYTVYRGGNTAPVISNEFPANGSTDIIIGASPHSGTGSRINVDLTDTDGNTMNVSIWSNFTGSWVRYAGYGLPQIWQRFILDIGDYYDTGSNTAYNSANGWQGNGSRGFYLSNPAVTGIWGMTDYSTVYYWSVNVTDGIDWTNQTFSFTTEANTPPTISNPSPSNGATGVSVGLASLSVTIGDNEDTFNWTITTSPNIGSSSANGASNGSKTCTVSGLSYDAYYTWTISVTDGTSWTNTTYDFTVESDPGTGPPPNSAPTISNPYPSDEATLIQLMPICHVLVADANLDSIDVNFYWFNETSQWELNQTNSSVSPGSTVYWNFSNASEYNTTYDWKVTAYDGTDNISRTFNFTTWTNEPQISWTIPTDGAIDISISGSIVNAYMFDYQGDNMNATIWSNYTGTWVNYAGWALWSDVPQGGEGFMLDLGEGFGIASLVAYNAAQGWEGNGTWGFYSNNASVTDNWGMTDYNTRYYLSINISDNSTERAWNNYTFSFTTELNTIPVITFPIPRDGKRWISIHTTNLSVVITDANSDFNYTIETDPDIGSSSGNDEINGVKGCTVSGLNYSTTYTWYVNATDGEVWTNASYNFTTKGSSDFDLEDFKLNLPEWAVGPFKVYVGDFVWMFLFIGAIAITWGSSKHVSSVFIVILLIFAAYGTQRVFVDNSEISLLFSIIAAICIASAMLGLYLRKRSG